MAIFKHTIETFKIPLTKCQVSESLGRSIMQRKQSRTESCLTRDYSSSPFSVCKKCIRTFYEVVIEFIARLLLTVIDLAVSLAVCCRRTRT